MDALNALMAGLNTTNEDGISEWAALTSELENCNGSLQQMRDMKLDNLEGDLKTLESATQDAGIKIYKHLNGPLREFAQFGTQAVYDASAALESDGFAGMAMSAGGALADGIGMVVERLPEFLAKAVVSVGSFLVGFATELPASLLKGIIKGVPRLLKALPGIGVDIVKAIVKGIFSIGGAPLKAIGSLFFDDKDDKKIKDAGAGIAEAQASGAGDDMATVADIPQAPQPAKIDGADMGDPIPSIERAEPIPADIPTDGAELENGADTGSQTLGIAQASVDVPMDIAQPVDGTDAMVADVPVATDVVPALQETGDLGVSIPSDGKEYKAPIGTNGMDAQPLEADMDTAGMGGDITVPYIDAPQDIVPTPLGDTSDIPIEVTQMHPGTIPDMGMGAAPISAGMIPDMGADDAQVSERATQVPADIVPEMGQTGDAPGVTGISDIIPDVTTAVPMEGIGGQAMADVPIQDTAVPQPGGTGIGKMQIPSVGIDMTGIGNGIARMKDILRTGVAGNMAGQDTNAPGDDGDRTALSGRTGAIGAPDGIGKAIGGISDTAKADASPSGIDAGGIAQMPQGLQIPQTPLQVAIPGVALRDAAPDTRVAQDMTKGATDTPGVYPQTRSMPATAGMRGPRGDEGAISNWLQDITDKIRTVLGMPDRDIPSGRSVVDETLDALTGKGTGQGEPSSSGPTTITYSPTIIIEGGGDAKEDVEKANKAGMREFERLMDQYLRKNKRVGFT